MKPKKLISSKICLGCEDPCCQFNLDEKDYGPIFTKDEYEKIQKIYKLKIDFKRANNSSNVRQVELVRSKGKNHYVCSYLDKKNWQCRIYKNRSLDCRLFPFILMKSEEGNGIIIRCYNRSVCPNINRVTLKDFKAYAMYLTKLFQSTKGKKFLCAYPGIVVDYDPDTIFIAKLG